MVFIFDSTCNPPRVRRIIRQVFEDVGAYERDPSIQWKKSGKYAVNLDTGERTRIGPTEIWISPRLNITLEDFPDDYSFGNGGSRPCSIKVNGQTVTFAIMTFPNPLSESQITRLQEIIEGIPPGNEAQNVWRPFTEDGALSPTLIDAELAALSGKASPTAMDERLMQDLVYIKANPAFRPDPPV